jgi:hypothetical protein
MKKHFYFLLLAMVAMVSCKKEEKPSYLFEGKIRTITDARNAAAPSTFFCFYDSITQKLSRIEMTYDTTKATRDGVFVITYQDDFVYINKNLKIKVNQLQILEMFSVDTTSHTDYSMLKVYLTGNKVDSIYEPGVLLANSNIRSNHFEYTNGNCTKLTMSWDSNSLFIPNGRLKDTLNFTFTNSKNKNQAWYQIPNMLVTVGFTNVTAFLLQMAGYHMLPVNNNLIDSFTNRNSTTKYSYEFFDNQNIKKVTMEKTEGAVKTTSYQSMTYF